MERGERAVHNEHGVSGAATTPSAPQAHSEMSVGNNVPHHQDTHAPSRMEVDEPSFSVPPTQAVGGMSTGSGPSTPVFSASSMRGGAYVHRN